MQTLKITVDPNEVFYYVTGIGAFDALERVIDPTRYELHETALFDKKCGKFVLQNEDYVWYMREVKRLKELAPNMHFSEIRRICQEISEIAPKELYV